MEAYALHHFFSWMPSSPFASYENTIRDAVYNVLEGRAHGDMHHWLQFLKILPNIDVASVHLNCDAPRVTSRASLTIFQKKKLNQGLMGLCPWRKGPFNFFEKRVDAEWRSHWKWNRIVSALTPLRHRLVLDVGCGSGYYAWRMLGQGAHRVIALDPCLLFMLQCLAFKKYAGYNQPLDFLPLTLEAFPKNTVAFDTVFSMGVLYHRKTPIAHLEMLFGALKQGGELILETLVIEHAERTAVLVPESRYAKMRNVWFIPSVGQLLLWLKRSKFENMRVVDITKTSIEEQRSTQWMARESLVDFLNKNDMSKTVEGYPAPVRAMIIAQKPR